MGDQNKSKKKGKGIPTGIDGWYQFVDPETGRAYFRNHDKQQSHWGLPLRAILKNPGVIGPEGTDDWRCFIDTESQRRFYQSKKYNKVQWRVPNIYKTTIGKLEYFSDDFAAVQKKKRDLKKAARKVIAKHEEKSKVIMEKVKIKDILDNSSLCAAFHRFLVSVYAEENLLFYGAVQVFEKGSFHGMDVMGIGNKNNTDDEGAEFLAKQLDKSRASVRIGLPLKRSTLKDEALIVYEKFLKPNAELWVCVDNVVAAKAKTAIEQAGDEDDIRGVFHDAEAEVLHTMSQDLFPRFLKEALELDGDVSKSSFKSDQMLQRALSALVED